MLELPPLEFVSVVVEIRRLATVLANFQSDAAELARPDVKDRMAGTIDTMREHLATIAAQSAWVAANRLHTQLVEADRSLSYGDIHKQIEDIERRFADHLGFIRLFVVRPEQLSLLGTAVELLGEPTASRFTSLWFDCEEAAKCVLVLRPTAAVFHAMRMLEIGIRAFATRLGIPDPVKPAERNWGVFLRSIKLKIDTDFPASKRLPGGEGAFLEALYATLDAVKNPWRNEVMHVEGVYTDAEAGFIVLCTLKFIQKMATSFDEHGDLVEPPAMLAPSSA
ncbi:hypothetical protein [Sphingomonas sp. Root241]|uniref:hypothetical protein n=1 Tax=Sphingomonas sp. Root241 TaxID=1736501 RepID=UPI0006FF338F|nr:hypothetical protein [Sphingomonas sp. Root241]KRC79087.1 hypothetical protein ASE13_16820 [Sphingomonas sp. Root241]